MQRPHKILAVDDNPINLKVLEALLVDYHVHTAPSGTVAVETAPQFRPDILLLDIMMPGIDGYETCRRIRSNPTLRHTKIIMVSSKADLSERLAGYDAGADDYIVKPFNSEELLAKVRVYLKLKSVQEIEEVKNRTIEVLQHSNRTPLNNIISYAELLTENFDLDGKTRAESVQGILRHARRLHRVLEKGETLASMKSGQFYFDFQHCDWVGLVLRVAEEMAPALADRRLSLELDLPERAATICDRAQMLFVCRALLDNAIRFSKPHGRILVRVEPADNTLALTVADHGPGISAELLPSIFEPYGNPESPLFNQGDGLSLAIAQQICWAHDGEINAHSKPGTGATFWVCIPTAGPAAAKPDAVRERCRV